MRFGDWEMGKLFSVALTKGLNSSSEYGCLMRTSSKQ